MIDNLHETAPLDYICKFEEDESVPLHEERLGVVVREMMESCADEDTVDHVEAALIPDKGEIIRVFNILKDVLFPGYFGKQELIRSALKYHLGNEMTTLFELLSAQISRSIRHECRSMDSLLRSMLSERS